MKVGYEPTRSIQDEILWSILVADDLFSWSRIDVKCQVRGLEIHGVQNEYLRERNNCDI